MDPGAYSPEMNQLAAQAKHTFQTTAKTGHSMFGSKVARTMKVELLGGDEVTPGPDTYHPDKATASNKIAMAAMSDKEKMPSSSFKSAGRKLTKVPQQDQPGPGAYSPDPDAIYNALPGASMKSNLISKTGRDHSLGGMDISSVQQTATLSITGPGSYNSHQTGSIAHSSSTKQMRMSKVAASASPGAGSLGFDSRSPARKLPHEAVVKSQTPGPSAYNPEASADVANEAKKTFNAKSKTGSSAFGAQEKLGYNPIDGRNLLASNGGDPGAYSPIATREIAHAAQKTFQTTYQAGKGAFGSTPASMTKRVMKLDILGGDEVTPGPDTYHPDKATASNKIAMAAMSDKEKMPSSSFKSAGRKLTKVPQQDQPGPGAYSPDPDAIYNALPGASMKSNLISKTGRDHWIGAKDIQFTMETATSAITGPGSYIPRVTNDGELSTLEARVSDKAMRGWSNYFTSDSIREMFTSLVSNDMTKALWKGHS